MNSDKRKCVVSVAGLDSSTGAGITADVAAITTLGMNAAVVCTAVTAQTGAGIRDIHPVPVSSVSAQLHACFDEFDVLAIKTGMLANADIVRALSHFLRSRSVPQPPVPNLESRRSCLLVVDPVMSATAGGQLLSEDGIAALMEELLPLAFVVTPNLPEAARLAGLPVENLIQMKDAARRIRELGVKNVIVTGGHLPDKATDVIYDGAKFQEVPGRKLPAKLHGTGCTYSAALATYLALGMPLDKAAAGAKQITVRRIEDEGV